MATPTTNPSYIIVGAGVFGASTAYHLIKTSPSASITLIDRLPSPCPLAASYDVNKIVRADYGDKFYMELALQAQHEWRTDPLYSQFYHESGMVNVEGTGLGRRMLQNYKELGVSTKAVVIGPEELKERYPLFWDTDYSAAKDCYVNPESGWAEAASSVKAVTQAAVDDGVEYVEGTVSRLLFDDQGDCFGVELKDGRIVKASKLILSIGAGMAKLIADSAPERPDMQVDDRIIGAAVLTGFVKLTPSQIMEYKDMPLFLHRVGGVSGNSIQILDYSHANEPLSGEAYPPTPEKVMKFCRDISFSNFYKHAESGQMISTPPLDQEDEGQSNVPLGLKDEIQTVMKGIWGKQAEGMEIDSYRICW